MKSEEVRKQILNNKVQKIINKVIYGSGKGIVERDFNYFEEEDLRPLIEEYEVSEELGKLGYRITKHEKTVKKFQFAEAIFLGIFKKEVRVEYEVTEHYYIVEA